MIKINLLPQDMAGGRGGAAAGSASSGEGMATALVVIALLLIFGVNGALGVYFYMEYTKAQTELDYWATQNITVSTELKNTEVKYNDEKANIEQMEQLISVYNSLDPPDRLLWSEKLNMLPMLVPEGIYLTRIEVNETVREEVTPESAEARAKWQANTDPNKPSQPPPEVRMPVITQNLSLEGVAYVPDGTPTQRLQQYNTFFTNLRESSVMLPFNKEERRFMQGFANIRNAKPIVLKNLAGRDVSAFAISLRTKRVEIR